MPFTYYILVYLYYDAVIICCMCRFYFSKYGGAINKKIVLIENSLSGFIIRSELRMKRFIISFVYFS